MATFLLDHNAAYAVRLQLANSGHIVTHTRDVRMARTPDDEILTIAAQNRWILVTHNVADFTLLHRAWLRWPALWGVSPPPEHAGILILPATLKPQPATSAIITLIGLHPLPINRLFTWQREGVWAE